MTPSAKQLGFFNGVIDALRRKAYSHFHWPIAECFTGECNGYGFTGSTRKRPCYWKDIQNLAFEFFNNAPDVDDHWKLNVSGVELNPDDFHELCVGVFISEPNPSLFVRPPEWKPLIHGTWSEPGRKTETS